MRHRNYGWLNENEDVINAEIERVFGRQAELLEVRGSIVVIRCALWFEQSAIIRFDTKNFNATTVELTGCDGMRFSDLAAIVPELDRIVNSFKKHARELAVILREII